MIKQRYCSKSTVCVYILLLRWNPSPRRHGLKVCASVLVALLQKLGGPQELLDPKPCFYLPSSPLQYSFKPGVNLLRGSQGARRCKAHSYELGCHRKKQMFSDSRIRSGFLFLHEHSVKLTCEKAVDCYSVSVLPLLMPWDTLVFLIRCPFAEE